LSIHELVLGHGQNAARTYGGKDADVAARGERHVGGRSTLSSPPPPWERKRKRKTKPGEMRRLTVET
jgi:hypothetical protein